MQDVFGSKFAEDIFKQKYSLDQKENWRDTVERVVSSVCQDKMEFSRQQKLKQLMYDRKFIPAGRYLYASGRHFHQVNNCFLFRAEDSREGWAELMYKISSSLMTGGGIGIDYSSIRYEGAPIRGTGGFCTGPIALMQMINEAGRHIMQGGQRRSAIWAGLLWNHPDILKFIKAKDWSKDVRRLKELDFNFPAPLDMTNISVNYDTLFFNAVEDESSSLHTLANTVWLENCRKAFSTAEPGMAFNYLKDRESLRNACTEVVSEDDSDKCNLGTLWLNRFNTIEEFCNAIPLCVEFLICGGMYSQLPNESVRITGDRNNRIGLGLGGMHEWLMLKGYSYEVVDELHDWLYYYETISEIEATSLAEYHKVVRPKGVRAIAPTGTIGILAESTTGIEPLFCKAYKRRYLKGKTWHYQYVVDGAVKRLQSQGVSIDKIQDAYDLSFEDRVKFQADVQDYVDMAISSTCNLPEWGSETNNETTLKENSQLLLSYAKRLRGFTCYPDGSRGGQPLTRVNLNEALSQEGKVFEEKEHECVGGVCGV